MKKILILVFAFSISICFSQFRNKEIKEIDILCNKLEHKKWLKVKEYDLIESDSDTKIYYSKNGIQKLIHTNFWETGKKTIIYLLINKQIVRVSEIELDYHGNYTNSKLNNREITTQTTKSYFQEGKIFHQIGEDCGAPFANDFLILENLRLQDRYKEILNLTKKD